LPRLSQNALRQRKPRHLSLRQSKPSLQLSNPLLLNNCYGRRRQVSSPRLVCASASCGRDGERAGDPLHRACRHRAVGQEQACLHRAAALASVPSRYAQANRRSTNCATDQTAFQDPRMLNLAVSRCLHWVVGDRRGRNSNTLAVFIGDARGSKSCSPWVHLNHDNLSLWPRGHPRGRDAQALIDCPHRSCAVDRQRSGADEQRLQEQPT
jgi:hypothetical protein